MKLFILFIISFVISCSNQKLSHTTQSKRYDIKKYSFLEGIVKEPSSSGCRANPRGSSFQLFENGWMVADFSKNQFYAVYISNQKLKWVKRKSGYIKSKKVNPCKNLKKSSRDRLRLGFREWYCSKEFLITQKHMGEPLALESRAWVQFQNMNSHLLIFGLPRTQQGVESGIYQSLAGFILENISENSGSGNWFYISEAQTKKDPRCSANWFKAEKDLSPNKNFQSYIKEKCDTSQVDNFSSLETSLCRFGF